MRNRAINALIEMGVSADTKGFYYIVDAMCMLAENESYVRGNTGALYECIAKKNSASYSRVERAIRHAFQSILTDGNTFMVDKYLSRSNTATGNLLRVLYIRLTQEE